MTHSHKKRWSYTTLVDHENNMVITLNLFDDKSSFWLISSWQS